MSNLEKTEKAEHLGQEVEALIKSGELDPAGVELICDPKNKLEVKPYEIPWTDWKSVVIMGGEIIRLQSAGKSPDLVPGMVLTLQRYCYPDKNSPKEVKLNPNPKPVTLVKMSNPFTPEGKFGHGDAQVFNGEKILEVNISELRFLSEQPEITK